MWRARNPWSARYDLKWKAERARRGLADGAWPVVRAPPRWVLRGLARGARCQKHQQVVEARQGGYMGPWGDILREERGILG